MSGGRQIANHNDGDRVGRGETSGWVRNVAGLPATSAAGFATNVIRAGFPRTANMQPASGQPLKMPP